MAAPVHQQTAVTPDTLITIKISVNDDGVRRLKLPLRDLSAAVLPIKLRQILGIKPQQNVCLERYSDSADGYVVLDPNDAAVFKTLIRAAKAKLKLRLKATVDPLPSQETVKQEQSELANNPAGFATRDSTAFDRRSVGSGIFHFREALASQQTLVNPREILPSTSVKSPAVSVITPQAPPKPEPPRAEQAPLNDVSTQWSIYCNQCDKPMADVHFHCSICDDGDYDLCQECVDSGKFCRGDAHWLVKRFIQDGKVTNSITGRVSPRKAVPASMPNSQPTAPAVPAAVAKPMLEAYLSDPKALLDVLRKAPSRTCNNCIVVLPENEFVTCDTCDDFDLCLNCHTQNRHGHSRAHGFSPATADTVLSLSAKSMLSPGRNVRHQAICDSCDNHIYGIRHKCQHCPDFDLCSKCVQTAARSHPRHRFAAIYDLLEEPRQHVARHFGIYCDGSACMNKGAQSYITGPRYKCAVCHDTDFCASCEASPFNTHNRTHPLILFKTPVRNVKITTQNEDLAGHVRVMGDRSPSPTRKSSPRTAVAETPASATHLKTKFQVMADIVPSDGSQKPVTTALARPSTDLPSVANSMDAQFVRDSVPDGTRFAPGTVFTQVWTMRNPGPSVWPSGCSVRFVGGDSMLNLESFHPSSTSDIAQASESNVVARAVEVNEEVAFKVTLKAPLRQGKAISYWRLKAADGTPFGHRLWCDITVQHQIPVALPIREVLPSQPVLLNAEQHGTVQQPTWAAMNRTVNLGSDEAEKRQVQPTTAESHFQPAPNPATHCCDRTRMDDKARKEAAKLRVEYIKAKILKAREERAKLGSQSKLEYAKQMHAGLTDQMAKQNKDMIAKQETVPSSMVFPTLEKESPENSTYQTETSTSVKGQVAHVENEEGEVESVAQVVAPRAMPEPALEEFEDVTDEIEVLSARDEFTTSDESDDGFLTDEEYDILDASDRETIV